MRQAILAHFAGDCISFYARYLPDLKKNGKGHVALCPFHDDKSPSLSINPETGQYFCHGCGKKGDLFHFYAKINDLDTRRDFGKILQGIIKDFGIKGEARPKARVVKTYDYTDEKGELLYQVCRMRPKDFRQRRPDGQGKWIWNLKGIVTVLYRLPELKNAQQVVIVEGEKDADSLHALGFVATTSPMGAKKWRDEYSECLRGKDVILCPDNDLEGREHMTRVAQSLQGIACSIKWLDLPNLPPKGDSSNFIEAFQDKEEAAERLSIMISEAPEYEPPKVATLEDAIFKIPEFINLNTEPRKNYLAPWLKELSIVLISGWRGSGKTWLALSILSALSQGQPFGPWKCEEPVPCLFLDGEMPPADIVERLRGLRYEENQGCPFYIYSDAWANQLGLPRAHLANEKWRREMKRILVTRRVKVWCIDNIASLASGLDENKKQDWDPINQWLIELRFAGITTLLLHHVSKEGNQRGTSAREDNLDVSIILKQPHDYVPEDGCRFILHFSKARVSQKELSLIGDTEFRLIEDGEVYTWTYGNVRREIKIECLRLFADGCDSNSIQSVLGISKGYVSKLKKSFIHEKLLSSAGKITNAGELFLAANS